jgi:hypothetical protein
MTDKKPALLKNAFVNRVVGSGEESPEQLTPMRVCHRCKKEKPIYEFVSDRTSKYGKGYECLECKRWRSNPEYQEYTRRHPDRVKESNRRCKEKNRAYQKRLYRELKVEILTEYGGRCVCCGESNLAFLTIDHVFNDGNKHRSKGNKHSGMAIYRFLKKNGFPKDRYQILCYNCNCSKQHDPEGHRAAHPNAIYLDHDETD